MDFNDFLNDYAIRDVVLACLVIGYCIKHVKKFEKISNDYIPMILAFFGMILAIILKWGEVTPNIIIAGAFSGLVSVGMHQMFKAFIEVKEV